MARGFIRAEVVAYEEPVAARSLGEARRRGKLRLEGKGYAVRDGDVLNTLFDLQSPDLAQAGDTRDQKHHRHTLHFCL
jgi:hypothetical protein